MTGVFCVQASAEAAVMAELQPLLRAEQARRMRERAAAKAEAEHEQRMAQQRAEKATKKEAAVREAKEAAEKKAAAVEAERVRRLAEEVQARPTAGEAEASLPQSYVTYGRDRAHQPHARNVCRQSRLRGLGQSPGAAGPCCFRLLRTEGAGGFHHARGCSRLASVQGVQH